MGIFLPIAAGVLGALAYPKASLWPLIFVFLVPLFIAFDRSRSLKEVLKGTVLFSLFYFGILFYGMSELYPYISFWAYFAWLGLVFFQMLYVFIFSIAFFKINSGDFTDVQKLLLLPSIWIVLEWLRSSLFSYGVAGGVLGYSLAGVLPIAQLASITGVWGVSFVVVLVNLLIFQLTSAPGSVFQRVRARLIPAAIVFGALILAVSFGAYRMFSLGRELNDEETLRVAIIQANIPQAMKLDDSAKWNVFEKNIKLTNEIIPSRPDVIIWPETVLRTYLFQDRDVRTRLNRLIRASGSHFIAGFPHYEAPKIFNSAYVFSPDANIIGRYDKQRPVPFGEYLPLRFILHPLLSSFGTRYALFEQGYDANPEPALLPVGPRKFGTAICYESNFPQIMRSRVRRGADVLLVITNDAWFGNSSLAAQHLDIGVFRAIETGRPFIQVANTGLSAVINPAGRVRRKILLGREAALVIDVRMQRFNTLYSRFGDFFVYLLILACAAFLVYKELSRRGLV
jgi:apolipoprotein N-acyltransferase